MRKRPLATLLISLVATSPLASAHPQQLIGTTPKLPLQKAKAVGDASGDGLTDYAVGQEYQGGYSRIYSGADLTSTVLEDGTLNRILTAFPDISSDGIPELIVQRSASSGILSIERLRGGDFQPGAVYLAGLNRQSEAWLLPDTNADGFPEVAILTMEGSGALRFFDGAMAVPIGTIVANGVQSVFGIGEDLDGDGLGELLVWGNRRLKWISPATALPVQETGAMTTQTISPKGDLIMDVDGDGSADLALLIPDDNELRVYSGTSGAIIWSRGEGADAVSSCGDVSADGKGDFLLGYPDEDSPQGVQGAGAIRAVSGVDGAVLWTIWGSRDSVFSGSGQRLGEVIESLGDLNGDQFEEFLTSATSDTLIFSPVPLPSGVFVSVGQGCAWSGPAPTIGASAANIGQSFTVFGTQFQQAGLVVVAVSAVPTNPIQLTFCGGTLYLSTSGLGIIAQVQASPTGTLSTTTAIPFSVPLIGMEFSLQALTVFGGSIFQASNALQGVVGI